MYLKEALVVPAVIFILSVVWMQLVKGKTSEESQKEQTKRDINFEQAYMVKIDHHSSEYMLIDTVLNVVLFQDAKLNEVDSGTELDSQGEEEAEEAGEKDKAEEPAATKDEEEKKED